MKKQLAAFTLMEVTIAMLISALVIGMTYTIYAIVNRSFTAFNDRNNAMAMVNRLDELFRKDFDRADNIEKTEKGMEMSNERQTVSYEILADAIVRTAGITDTFKVAITASALSFENRPVTSSAPGAEASRIDDVYLLFTVKNDTLSGHYHKTYSSSNLMNRNAHAVN